MRKIWTSTLIAGFTSIASTLAGCGDSQGPSPIEFIQDAGPFEAGTGSTPDAAGSPDDAATASLDGASTVDADAAASATDAAGSDADAAPPGDASVPSLRCQVAADHPQGRDYSKPGPHTAATLEVTWEDKARPIVATDKHGAAPSRRLETMIYYPASGPAPLLGQAKLAEGGPFPLLMYSHGYSSSRDEARAFATRAASYGYVVVAPNFPLTSTLANGGAPDVNDAANQPGDVSFLIDQVLALSADSKHPLAGGVDEKRIGTLGVSLGGLTTLLISYHPKFHDTRIKAAAPIAPLAYFFAPAFYHTRELPLLIVHGDLDSFIDYEANGRRAFMRASPNARLLTVKKGSHAAFAFPLDESGFGGVLNALLARPDADPSNPDGLGCGAVGDTLASTGVEFLEALGDGAESLIMTTEEEAKRLLPCTNGNYKKPAMKAADQLEIATRSTLSFFEAHLGATSDTRDDGCHYLVHEVVKNPSVILE